MFSWQSNLGAIFTEVKLAMQHNGNTPLQVKDHSKFYSNHMEENLAECEYTLRRPVLTLTKKQSYSSFLGFSHLLPLPLLYLTDFTFVCVHLCVSFIHMYVYHLIFA